MASPFQHKPAPIVTIYKKTRGLNNKVDATRLVFEVQEGLIDLAAAVNVEIDPTGRISRRKGYQRIYTGPAHSLFWDGWSCLFCAGSSMYQLLENLSATQISTGITENTRMYYAQVGAEIYWMNGFEKGIFNCPVGVNRSWIGNDYVGPDINRSFTDVPIGTSLVYYRSRVYVAVGNVIWYTEPFAYSWVDRARNYLILPGNVSEMFATEKGFYVSIPEKDTTLFISGETVKDLTPKRVCEGIIAGTVAKVDLNSAGMEGEQGYGYFFTTRKGVYVAKDGGVVSNLTRDRLTYPATTKGAGLVNEDKYIVSLIP
jgi:hypothetical protein